MVEMCTDDLYNLDSAAAYISDIIKKQRFEYFDCL